MLRSVRLIHHFSLLESIFSISTCCIMLDLFRRTRLWGPWESGGDSIQCLIHKPVFLGEDIKKAETLLLSG